MAETVKVRYVGPFKDGVFIPALEDRGLPGEVPQNGVIEVPLDLAAALTLQADWQAVGKAADPIAEAQQSIPVAAIDPQTGQIVVPPAPLAEAVPYVPPVAPVDPVAPPQTGGN